MPKTRLKPVSVEVEKVVREQILRLKQSLAWGSRACDAHADFAVMMSMLKDLERVFDACKVKMNSGPLITIDSLAGNEPRRTVLYHLKQLKRFPLATLGPADLYDPQTKRADDELPPPAPTHMQQIQPPE
jgi:hypothetical protein